MKVWVNGEVNTISVLWNWVSNSLVAEYRMDGTTTWTQIGTLVDNGDRLYSIPATITTNGVYTIRVRDTSGSHSLISKVEVKQQSIDTKLDAVLTGANTNVTDVLTRLNTLQDYLCACSTNSAASTDTQLATIDSGLKQILTNLGDSIAVNQVKIDNSAKTMSMII